MKTNKEQIYELIQLHFTSPGSGVSTQYVADMLHIRRPNASALLNELVAEGRVVKTTGRPVLYYCREDGPREYACFEGIVGREGSLRRAIQLIQAAVLYPPGSLPLLLTGERGTGKTLLAHTAFQFAQESGVLLPDALYHTEDCRDWAGGDDEALQKLFGTAPGEGLFGTLKGDVLVLENAHLLSAPVRSRICEAVERQEHEDEAGRGGLPLLILTTDSAGRSATEELSARLPLSAVLPPLAQRPLRERLELVQLFLGQEAARANRTLTIRAELLHCLLLYDCSYNVAQLKSDIKIGCAGAYVRSHNTPGRSIEVFLSDFEYYVRKGFLNYHKQRFAIEELIDPDYSYSFSRGAAEAAPAEHDGVYAANMYQALDRKAGELRARGISEKDINLMLEAELEVNFNAYRTHLAKQAVNREQLARLVEQRVIDLVEEFLSQASTKFSEGYPPSVYYGLSLHIHSVLQKGGPGVQSARLTPTQVSEVVENHKEKYLFALQFASRLEKEFSLQLPTEEVVLITMFLCIETPGAANGRQPAMLFACHGEGIASGIAATVNTVTGLGNTFAVDIPLEEDTDTVYERLKACIEQADNGKGVVVLYDMDVLRELLLSISLESGIEVRMAKLPILTVGILSARLAAASSGIDDLYKEVLRHLSGYNEPAKRLIVTLCTTGEGGAQQLKSYLEQYGNLGERAVVPLAISDRELLRTRLLELMQSAVIDCIVGTFDPGFFSIPFIPVSEVFGAPPEQLPALLNAGRPEKEQLNLDEMFGYLAEHLEHTDLQKLRRLLPPALQAVSEKVQPMNIDIEIGLFLHIACCINRLLAKQPPQQNLHKAEIYKKYEAEFKTILSILRPLEKGFGIIFSDDEVANMLAIIYKL